MTVETTTPPLLTVQRAGNEFARITPERDKMYVDWAEVERTVTGIGETYHDYEVLALALWMVREGLVQPYPEKS